MQKELYKKGHRLASQFLDPETRHNLVIDLTHRLIEPNPVALQVVEYLLAEGKGRLKDSRLHTTLAKGALRLDNPVIVAAGLDKNGKIAHTLYKAGAGAVEVGSVLYLPQPGNPKPRLHEPPSANGFSSLINSMGFNSDGVLRLSPDQKPTIKENLARYDGSGIIVGINIGLNKRVLQDKIRFPAGIYPDLYAYTAGLLYQEASYFVINVSSPNTPGLRDLQEEHFLTDAIDRIYGVMDKKGGRKPIYIKLSPDLEVRGIEKVINVVESKKISGVICSNTTINQEIKAGFGPRWAKTPGGVSGSHPAYRRLVLKQTALVYEMTQGDIDIIVAGGIHDLQSLIESALAGGNAFEALTALTRSVPGPFLLSDINVKLLDWMSSQGLKNLSQIRGLEAKRFSRGRDDIWKTIYTAPGATS